MTEHEDTQTMSDVSHTHPYTDRGAINRPFERGPTVAADGGRRDAYEDEPQTMADVSHTAPYGDDDVNRVFERGNEYVGDR